MRIRDVLGEVYGDEAFSAAFAVRGKPGISPAQLMIVTVLQFTENLTGRPVRQSGIGSPGSSPSAWSWRIRGSTPPC